MTIRGYLNAHPCPPAHYKDCEVVDIDVISPRYALITVRLPLHGGDHREIVPLDTELDLVERRGGECAQ